MARSRSRSKGRAPRAKSRKSGSAPPPAAAEVEIVEDEKGLGVEDGIVICTAVLLVVACLLVDMDMGKYGKGIFF